jgi:hypothetical protein
VVLKLDFEKAFNIIEHYTIMVMLQKFGFPEKWVGWTRELCYFLHIVERCPRQDLPLQEE